MSEEEVLFTPIKVGKVTLGHRLAFPPVTRYRCDDDGTPNEDLAPQYYSERCLVPGTLVIAEATDVSYMGGGYPNSPGIYTERHIAGWKKVTDAVHAKKGFIFLQIWNLGRVNPGVKQSDVFSASDVQMPDRPKPRPLTIDEIHQVVEEYGTAAKNAMQAGFDGIEIHGAHGYLIDQFMEDVTNLRTDEYGGTIEKRARFGLEVVAKCVEAIGAENVAIRLSPFSKVQAMRMKDLYPQFSYFVEQLQDKFPGLAYVHMVEPRAAGNNDQIPEEGDTTEPFRKLWKGVWIAAGGYNPKTAREYAATHPNSIVAVGRHFLSNPDLVAKYMENMALDPYDRSTFYINKAKEGYIGYNYSPALKGKYY
ncbi:uncharacterized protein V2V93DRAFT_258208 [Kockiozyma suomiensis]|uniref:uncharacterized protein n=1 Tax=Kockiozyma suomiensis TaxID=1337062 RepID=UPI0033438C1F